MTFEEFKVINERRARLHIQKSVRNEERTFETRGANKIRRTIPSGP